MFDRFRRGGRGAHEPSPGAVAAPPRAAGAVVTLHPIGVVSNGVARPRAGGWETVESVLRIAPAFTAGLAGIDGFSHLIALTWLHLAAAEPRELLAIHPGGDPRLPLTGVFALRVGGRPNPIGLSVVRLLGVHGADLRVRGLDAVDGTPLLDLKPYLPPYDSVPEALLPGWALPGCA